MSDIVILNSESESFRYLCQKDKRLAKVVSLVGEITYKTYSGGKEFEFIIHEIIEQMLSIKSGAKIYARLEELCNGKITPQKLADFSIDEIKQIGTSASKAKSIKSFSEAVLDESLDLKKLSEKSDEEVLKELRKIHGIGTWTAKMFLIFALDRQDILPFEDVAFLQSYCWMYKTDDRIKESVTKKCKKWKTYSSIAARYLYRAFDMGLTKQVFHLKK